MYIVRVLSIGGVGGKVLPQTPHLPPQKFEIKKITQSAMRTYTELDQLSDQTLNNIIDKYKYMLLNTRHAWYMARPFPPQTKISRLNPDCMHLQKMLVIATIVAVGYL